MQELQQLVCQTRQEARAQRQAAEHEAECLRIEIVTLRDALNEEMAARASLEGQLRGQREETGKRPGDALGAAAVVAALPELSDLSPSFPQRCWRVSSAVRGCWGLPRAAGA